MYERVLIPLDGSKAAEAILPFVEEIAGLADAEVVLLRVVEPVTPAGALADTDPLGSDGLALGYFEAKRYLTEVAERLAAKGLRVRSLLALGNAASAILAKARAHGVAATAAVGNLA